MIVAVGFNAATEGEGHDRTFNLPWGQDALVEAMVAANPHTIVDLTGGGGMDVEPWLDTVPVLVDDWYPGQEGGTAVADVLFGKHDPEGRLPVSWDRAWSDNPSHPWYYGNAADDTILHTIGRDGKPLDYTVRHIVYGDKLMVGYRYWTTSGKHPLFPFGFGLSYTTFSFANLNVPATAKSGDTVPVSFDVTNTGDVEGAEVAQLYVSDPSAKVDRPERELKGFEKVDSGARRNQARVPQSRCTLLQLLERRNPQLGHRPRQVRHPGRRFKREHPADRGYHAPVVFSEKAGRAPSVTGLSGFSPQAGLLVLRNSRGGKQAKARPYLSEHASGAFLRIKLGVTWGARSSTLL